MRAFAVLLTLATATLSAVVPAPREIGVGVGVGTDGDGLLGGIVGGIGIDICIQLGLPLGCDKTKTVTQTATQTLTHTTGGDSGPWTTTTTAAPPSGTGTCGCPTDLYGDNGTKINTDKRTGVYQCAYPAGSCEYYANGALKQDSRQKNCAGSSVPCTL